MIRYKCRNCKNFILQLVEINDDRIPKELRHIKFHFVCYKFNHMSYSSEPDPGCSAFVPIEEYKQ